MEGVESSNGRSGWCMGRKMLLCWWMCTSDASSALNNKHTFTNNTKTHTHIHTHTHTYTQEYVEVEGKS